MGEVVGAVVGARVGDCVGTVTALHLWASAPTHRGENESNCWTFSNTEAKAQKRPLLLET